MPSTPLQLDADFDSASLDTANSRVEGDVVYLAGRDNGNPRKWKWLYFRVSGAGGRRVVFRIGDHFEESPGRLDRHRMVYSFDGQHWRYFDHHVHDAAANVYEFANHEPFPVDVGAIEIAYGLPYPLWMLERDVARWRGSPFVAPTRSADADLVLGQSSGGVDELGRPVGPFPLYGFQITEPRATGPKRSVVLMSGVHPNETLGNHVLAGLVDWLLGDIPGAAAALRAAARFCVYPMVNPDGRSAGYNRTTVQHPDRDINRYWRDDLAGDMGEVRTMIAALHEDTGDDVDYFIDFHAWTDTARHFGFVSHDAGFDRDPFWLALQRLEPDLGHMDSGWRNASTETFAYQSLGARFAMTFECMFLPGWPVERYHALGRRVGAALHHALVRRGGVVRALSDRVSP